VSISRRTFGAIAISAAAASTAKIRVAMIGKGHGHANSKIAALQSMTEYDFIGVDHPQAFDDPSIELIACEDADADTNLANAQRAIGKGKHVHLDKPPGSNANALRKLLADAAARRLAVQMGYQWRYHPAMQAAMHAAKNGWLGRIHRFRASIDKPILADERKHLAKYRGGMMFSEGCHLIDRATALLGKPVKITGFIRHHGLLEDALADNNLVILEYPNAFADISLAGFDPQGNQHRYIEILGSNGSARVQPFTGSHLTIELKDAAGPYAKGLQTLSPPEPPGKPYTPDFAELAATIRHGAPPTYSAAHDLMTHEVLLEACGML
jgi:predicted dehydrogenase